MDTSVRLVRGVGGALDAVSIHEVGEGHDADSAEKAGTRDVGSGEDTRGSIEEADGTQDTAASSTHDASTGGQRGQRDGEACAIAADLAQLEVEMKRLQARHAVDIRLVDAGHRADAINLTHYLALRGRDERSLQRQLGRRGLSSLGRCEPHVLATVESVRAALGFSPRVVVPPSLSFEAGRAALDVNTDALFGPRPGGRVPRVMVTLPGAAAADEALVRHLVASGMDVARINAAHDGPDAWEAMARNVRKAADEIGRPCRISIDLPGPKLRTGPLVDGPRVVRLRPTRDTRGVAVIAARVALVSGKTGRLSPDGLPELPVDGAWLEGRQTGDVIDVVDTRGSRRQLVVVDCEADRCTAEVWNTTYVETGMRISCGEDHTTVGDLPPVSQYHLLREGDRLRLTSSLVPAEPWVRGRPGVAGIGCTIPAVLEVAQPGQHVVLDDGKLTGVVERVEPGEVLLRIDWAPGHGAKLRSHRGINLPEVDLPVEAVTPADLPLLRIAAAHADMVALSFLRHERDVDALRDAMADVGAENLGIVLKVETGPAFRRLPEILLHAMRTRRVGVMIARGDLAVEAGYERLAEMQEEILWLCEAAHVPVIWATAVLDHLARTGQPSRAEVTDAAMAQRAECVMLNKGPHVDSAIVALDDILRRMAGHQRKKTSLLRPLRSWEEDV